MSENATYNGWTNYETWNVKLWMDNEEGSYRHCQRMAETAWEDAEADQTFTRLERAQIDLADALKDEYEEAMHDWLDESGKSGTVWADLLGAALSEVDWREIATSMLEDVDKTEEAEEDDDEFEPWNEEPE